MSWTTRSKSELVGYCSDYYLRERKVSFLTNFSANRGERYWTIICYQLFITFLWTRIMFRFFHSLRNESVSRRFLKIRCNVFDIEEAQNFVTRIEISSWLWDLIWSDDLIILTISSTQNSKDESLSLVSKFILTGTVLSLDIELYCQGA